MHPGPRRMHPGPRRMHPGPPASGGRIRSLWCFGGRMRTRSTTVEQRIARLAGRAEGVVTRAELLEAGMSRDQIRRRVRRGALIREFPGVYRVGHRAPGVRARYMAAVKACGPGAVLSGLAAAYLLGLIKRPPPLPEVTAPSQRRVKGVRTRRSGRIERMTVTGIPITTVARTLADIAADLDEDDLALACHEAGVRYKTTPRHVQSVLDRRPNAPGAGKLKRIMGGDIHVSLSALERKFLARLREAGLPLPAHTNKPAGSKRVDCRWPEQKLTVELDSYRYHNTRHAWEQDRKREREAHARGDQHRRYTWDDVFEHPAQMLAELTRLLPRAV
ncbi:MAG: type IV toxin-antitoxin system AbiEi family antitoxin domain-containing protein [Thermoleophilaceae bacterium]